MRKPTFWFPIWPDTNETVQLQKKGADQLRGYREADLRLCFAYANCWFSHDAAQVYYYVLTVLTYLE